MTLWNLICEMAGWGMYDPAKLGGAMRSSQWPAFRKRVMGNKPCALCGGMEKRELHHKQSFKDHPEMELLESNTIVLCEEKKWGVTCHQFFGHRGNYKKINETVEVDVAYWHDKLLNP